ncbi:hypothetical protein PIROE2DRAFT_1709, partial [Piromyces sp. E2]
MGNEIKLMYDSQSQNNSDDTYTSELHSRKYSKYKVSNYFGDFDPIQFDKITNIYFRKNLGKLDHRANSLFYESLSIYISNIIFLIILVIYYIWKEFSTDREYIDSSVHSSPFLVKDKNGEW